jgi:hypothetical protein
LASQQSTRSSTRQAIAGGRVAQLPGLGHMPREEDPAASLAAAKSFLGVR